MKEQIKSSIEYICNRYGIPIYELDVKYVNEDMYGTTRAIITINGVTQQRVYNSYISVKKIFYKDAIRVVQVYTQYLHDRVRR